MVGYLDGKLAEGRVLKVESGAILTRRHSIPSVEFTALRALSASDAMQAVAHASASAAVGAMMVAEATSVCTGMPLTGSMVWPMRP